MEIGLLMIAGGIATGLFGSLLGLGGGVLLVPLLTLGFGLPVREAAGVSLVCVIVTSGASAAVFLDRGVANLRLGMTLELFTAIGALVGGMIAFRLDDHVLAGLFSILLAYTATTMLRRRGAPTESSSVDLPGSDGNAAARRWQRLRDGMSGATYQTRAPLAGAAGGLGAGVISALLGIGGGLVMVPVMHILMGVPLRAATATSNMILGITASTSALVYLLLGGLDPFATGPAAVGVFLGAAAGSRVAHRVDVGVLRFLFAAVLAYTAYLMLRRATGI